MSKAVAPPQDLPPPGGFGKVSYEKVPHRTFFNGSRIALTAFVSYAVGSVLYTMSCQRLKKIYLEQKSGQIATQPFLLAERDRQLLRQMRRNRDAEAELMKDVEGWEVGTLYGTPVFSTLGENEWVEYSAQSYYAHADPQDRMEYENSSHWL
ncbi:hypothetical protein FOCC_FOCC005649 [Frankliniella occidentalis]|uniref:NADH dehydrogenase [ubiquinone] 1 alpha subcomplex subunit 13 n=1 Tax=Frankliniella occidentalis TaxID=133901 RepID=A0A6J1TVB8_FRAOC|nr:NADH dehydrogenase [ubiquinone] 1 alpha subcomplex subunit 13 [Frankliniella occidentalis]KAE8747670.1 hypothetical protein FOCC_FOCC005649 [Frankliniella occidentalis]